MIEKAAAPSDGHRSGSLQVTGRVSDEEAAAFIEYANSLHLSKTSLASLLVVREIHRRTLSKGRAWRRVRGTCKITAHLRNAREKEQFHNHAAQCGLSMGDAAAAVFRIELQEQWLAREVRGKPLDST